MMESLELTAAVLARVKLILALPDDCRPLVPVTFAPTKICPRIPATPPPLLVFTVPRETTVPLVAPADTKTLPAILPLSVLTDVVVIVPGAVKLTEPAVLVKL